jgi:hypothetical protein
MPAYLLDQANFVATFLGRENVNKVNNGRHIDYVLRSLPHFMFPWTGAALAGIYYTFGHMIRPKKFFQSDPVMAQLGLSMALPTIVFFCAFPYKGQNYNIPTISCIILMGFATFGTFPKWSHKLASVIGVVALLLFSALIGRFFGFFNMPQWWPVYYAIGALLCLAAFAVCFWFATNTHTIAVGTLALFAGFALAITPIGTRELIGIQKFIETNKNLHLHYYNLEPTIWSEWVLMELSTGREIRGLHKPEQIKDALSPGHALIVPGNDALEMLQLHAKKMQVSMANVEMIPWTRWLTKGTNRHGQKLWTVAWEQRSLHVLEREYYILYRH